MQVGINTFSFSYLKFNFEFNGQKLKSIEKRFQIASFMFSRTDSHFHLIVLVSYSPLSPD